MLLVLFVLRFAGVIFSYGTGVNGAPTVAVNSALIPATAKTPGSILY
ncbi:hypothetical protein [Francisella tularensis]|nr:hypothetical protein [Francisella tularensis]